MKSKKLYSSKQIWKVILSVIALLIIGISLWYTNFIAKKIQEDERLRVKLWSETVKKQAQLVNLTTQTFSQLKAEEQKNMQEYGEALKELNRDKNDYSFVISFISKYENFPKIVEVISYKNNQLYSRYSGNNIHIKPEDFENDSLYQDTLKALTKKWDLENTKIEIPNLINQSQVIHYGNSKLFVDLKTKNDSLINSFENELIKNTALVPILYIDSATGKIKKTINIDPEKLKDSISIVETIAEMEAQNGKITVSFDKNNTGEIYYFESQTLQQLRYYPFIQIIIIFLFLLVSYFLFSTFRKAEQNQVWAGMAKETAHQLGTPLSSLMAWVEIIKADGVPESSIIEMNKDLNRLNTITDRFSKIGSEVKTSEKNVYDVISNSVNYLKSRVSKNVELNVIGDNKAIALLNEPLFEWVIENLTKNAIDAMRGKKGNITYEIETIGNKVKINITDSGKGIPTGNFKTIFNPGYSTKERGWGLGLSLVKRIVEDHQGYISVESEKDKGSTFIIKLHLIS